MLDATPVTPAPENAMLRLIRSAVCLTIEAAGIAFAAGVVAMVVVGLMK